MALWLTVAFILVVLTCLIRWRKKKFSYFKELGIPGPEPNLLWGNIWEYHSLGRHKALDKWCREYGDICGFYNGDVPFLVVKDLDFLKYAYIENFKNFTARGVTMRTDQQHPVVGQMVIHVRGDKWRRMRSCVTSGFTTRKLKQMVPHIAESAEVFMDMLEPHADTEEEVNLRLQFQALSMDYIGQAAFGIETCFQREVDDIFFTTARRVLPGVMTGPAHMIAQSTTTLGKAMKPFYWFLGKFGSLTFKVFSEETTKMIEMRKTHPELRKPDILQNLLDAELEDEALSEAVTKSGAQQTADSMKKRVRALSPREVIMNATLLFMGGFESTSISMCYLTFLLAKHQDVQDRLREEVKEAVSESGTLDYKVLTKKLKYLIQVVEEGLRLHPPTVVATSRQAEEDFEWRGVKFKAGTCIMSPTFQLHRDPRYWVDPDTFDPERFSPENQPSIHKMAFQPFGLGPRHCVGFQMARLEIRYTLARLVQRYRVELGESQKGEMKMGGYAMMSAPENGPWLKLYKL
ncbi:cytochrome P450 3A14-like isoform X2 [Dermacentor andersoni]|uniref:cytochrome P450 3A14-like isoform X2 n=1 Tax=Dermacentor andersoni TaxID=34620 RepID=UPI0024171D90|nr:cytochrome P450 3A14-like isoform X2 [Dermacentor andersoni]